MDLLTTAMGLAFLVGISGSEQGEEHSGVENPGHMQVLRRDLQLVVLHWKVVENARAKSEL